MGGYVITTGELYHHGVKGMKWGVRRYQNKDGSLTAAGKKRNARADQAIRRIGKTRKQNELEYEEMNATSRDRYSGKDKKLKRSLAVNKALYDSSEVVNRYAIARQQAKKDKSYKMSDEYLSAKKAYSKQQAQKRLYGEFGHRRIEQLKNMGSSEKQAKNRALTEQLLAGAIAAGVIVGGEIVGLTYLQGKR